MTEEELMLCLPYSETEPWVRVLLAQLALGGSRLQGPPGLLEKMAARLSSSTEREITHLYLNLTATDVKIMDGLGPAPA
jgi:hypothetical protein